MARMVKETSAEKVRRLRRKSPVLGPWDKAAYADLLLRTTPAMTRQVRRQVLRLGAKR